MQNKATGSQELEFLQQLAGASNRRTFLTWAGITVAAVSTGCSDSTDPDPDPDPDPNPDPDPDNDPVNLGTGDTGVLNYAYALEQLEAAFYTQVIAQVYAGITPEETSILTDIRDHEVVHRDFLKAALAANAIADLEVTFDSVDFDSRTSVLGTAKAFEDLGVAAYNGAGQLLADAGNLLVAGKIVSVEARHAAAIRTMLEPGSAAFAGDDVVDPATGLDDAQDPPAVLAAADGYIVTTIDASGLA